jgi:hypothetical protein
MIVRSHLACHGEAIASVGADLLAEPSLFNCGSCGLLRYCARRAHDIVLIGPIGNRYSVNWQSFRPASEATAIGASLGLHVAREALMRPTNESTLRARARKLGYSIHKSRSRSIDEDNLGKYALVKEDSKNVVLGERFDASLEEIAEYLS